MTEEKKKKAKKTGKKEDPKKDMKLDGFSKVETERTLKHTFTKLELEDLQKQIAREYANLNLVESEKASVVSSYGTKIKTLKSTLGGLAQSINQGYTHIPMKCVTIYNWKAGIKTLAHPETGEILEEEKIADTERQMKLPVLEKC